MKLLLFITAMLISFATQAAISGEWVGWGLWTYEDSGVNCNMRLSFSENAHQVVRHGGYFECNLVGLETYEAVWDLNGTNLMSDGNVVGSYDGKSLHVVETANETTDIFTDITIENDVLVYSEKWIKKDGTIIYEIMGNLKKK